MAAPQTHRSNGQAVAYVRLSAAREGADETLETQEATTRRLAEAAGLELVRTFSEGAGVSAFSGVERPELEAALAYVREHPGTALVAWEVSRLTRRLADLSTLVELVDQGARIVTPQLDTATSSGRLLLAMFATMAEEESSTKSTRVRDGKDRQRNGRRWLGGAAPFGLRLTEEGSLVVDHGPAEVVRGIFARALDGAALRAIAAELNAAREPSPSGGAWRASTLSKLLTSAALAGLYDLRDPEPVGNRGKVRRPAGAPTPDQVEPAPWPAVVEPATFWRVQAALGQRSGRRADGSRASKGRPPSAPLSGLLRCETCGGALTFDASRNVASGGAYRCTANAAGSCSAGVTIAATAEQDLALALFRRVSAMLDHPEDHADELDRLSLALGAERRPEVEGERARLEGELAELAGRLDSLTELVASGTLDPEGFASARARVVELRTAAEAALAALPAPRGVVAELVGWADGVASEAELEDLLAAWAALPVERRRQLLRVGLGRVTVHRVGQGRRVATLDRVTIG